MVTVGRVLFAAIQRWLPEPPRVPAAAVRAGRRLRGHRRPARRRLRRRGARLRARRARLLGAAAAHDQLRPGGPRRHLGGDGRPGDRRLPARLRHRRLRRRSAPGRRRLAAGDLRHRRRRRRRDGRRSRSSSPAPATSSPRCNPDRPETSLHRPTTRSNCDEPQGQGGDRHRRQQRHRQGHRARARRGGRQHRHRLRRQPAGHRGARAAGRRPRRPGHRRRRRRQQGRRPRSGSSTAAVEAFGRVDVMVNNAGIETRTSILDTTEAQYEQGAGRSTSRAPSSAPRSPPSR